MQGSQPIGARPGAVAALALEVFEEQHQKARVESLDVQLGWFVRQTVCGELEEEPEGIPITGDGVRAGAELSAQAIGEESLKERCQGAGFHRAPPCWRAVDDSVASWRSSGIASMYQ